MAQPWLSPRLSALPYSWYPRGQRCTSYPILELLVWLTVTVEVFVWVTSFSLWPALTFVFTFIVVPPQSIGRCCHCPTALLTSYAGAPPPPPPPIVEVLVWVTMTLESLLWVTMFSLWPALTFVFTCMPRPPYREVGLQDWSRDCSL
jgi:hypothetical protein